MESEDKLREIVLEKLKIEAESAHRTGQLTSGHIMSLISYPGKG
jgi:hypothetical protein